MSKFLFLPLLFLLMIPMVRGDPTTISACQDITEPGDYIVDGDLGTSYTCIYIKADNVTLDLNYHSIAGTPIAYGITGFYDQPPYSYGNNIIIKNGLIDFYLDASANKWGIGFSCYNRNNITLENITYIQTGNLQTTASKSYGFLFNGCDNLKLINISAYGSHYGLSILNSENVEINDSIFQDNNISDIFVSDSVNVKGNNLIFDNATVSNCISCNINNTVSSSAMIGSPLDFIGEIVGIILNPTVLYMAGLGVLAFFVETSLSSYDVKTGGKAFIGIFILGVNILVYFNKLPKVIWIIETLLALVLFAYAGKKIFTG